MGKMVQIRNVPEELHRKLKARAALEGLTLSDYLKREVERLASAPTAAELKQRLAARRPVRVIPSPAAAVREEREGR